VRTLIDKITVLAALIAGAAKLFGVLPKG
jgi:hypothetical protein